jgi:hypothetical protein
MIVVIILFITIALVDLPALRREKNKKQIIACASIFLLGLTLWTLYTLDVNIPSPMIVIGNFMKNTLHLSY